MSSSILYIGAGISPWFGMIAGAALAAALGGFIGFLTFRYKLKGAFFALATFAFSEMLRIIALNWEDDRKGHGGYWIPLKKSSSFQAFYLLNKQPYYYIILLMVVCGSCLSPINLDHSKLGYYLKAIREDEDAAGAPGHSYPQI